MTATAPDDHDPAPERPGRPPVVDRYGRGEAWEDNPEGRPVLGRAREGYPGEGGPCWYWRTDADGTASWGPASRPTPQWTRTGATPEKTLGRTGDHS